MPQFERITLIIESQPGARAQVQVNIPTPTPGMRLETPAHALAIDALGWLGKQPAVAGFVYGGAPETHEQANYLRKWFGPDTEKAARLLEIQHARIQELEQGKCLHQIAEPAASPFMYAIADGYGNAFFEEQGCVSSEAKDLQPEVDSLNQNLDGEPPYAVVAVYTHPAAAHSTEKNLDTQIVDFLAENYLGPDFRWGEPATEVAVIEMPRKQSYRGDFRTDMQAAMNAAKEQAACK